MKADLTRWVQNVHHQFRKNDKGCPTVKIQTDSSIGWGFVFDNIRSNGRWKCME